MPRQSKKLTQFFAENKETNNAHVLEEKKATGISQDDITGIIADKIYDKTIELTQRHKDEYAQHWENMKTLAEKYKDKLGEDYVDNFLDKIRLGRLDTNACIEFHQRLLGLQMTQLAQCVGDPRLKCCLFTILCGVCCTLIPGGIALATGASLSTSSLPVTISGAVLGFTAGGGGYLKFNSDAMKEQMAKIDAQAEIAMDTQKFQESFLRAVALREPNVIIKRRLDAYADNLRVEFTKAAFSISQLHQNEPGLAPQSQTMADEPKMKP